LQRTKSGKKDVNQALSVTYLKLFCVCSLGCAEQNERKFVSELQCCLSFSVTYIASVDLYCSK